MKNAYDAKAIKLILKFSEEAIEYCSDIDLNKYENQIDVFDELHGTEIL